MSQSRIRWAHTFPCVHVGLCLIGFAGVWLLHREGLDLVGRTLAMLDFPVSLLAMILAWILPEWAEIIGFVLLGTWWWYYLGRKLDERIDRSTHAASN